MSLVEVMIALTVLTFSVFMVTSTISAAGDESKTRLERATASQAAMNCFEEMRAASPSLLFRLYNIDPSDDPDGPGTAPGAHFDVEGLKPADVDQDGRVGKIVMSSPGPILREDTVNTVLGMPRDLDGDCKIDDVNHAADYIVLPVQVLIEWKGKHSKQTVSMFTNFAHWEKK
jgi:hypothetical protein